MNRRTFLATLLFGSTSAFVGVLNQTADRIGALGGEGHPVTHIFSDVSSARMIGKRYLATKDLDRATLLEFRKHICHTARYVHSERDFYKLREGLREKVRGDYQHGRCVCIDGWVLSITEARLCAIVSL
jgi:hypothetical protein